MTGKRGGAGRGQGRKALAGEVRKTRPLKATDAEWDAIKLVTPGRVRQWAMQEAAKIRETSSGVEPNPSNIQGDAPWSGKVKTT